MIDEQNCQLVTDYGGKDFNGICSVAIGPNDEVFVADRDNEEVIIFDKDLKLIKTFGQGSGGSKLNDPAGIAVGHNVIAISEGCDAVVKKFSLQGDFLSEFGSCGSGDGQFNNPIGLCFNSKGLLYVVDCNNQRVQVFRKNVFLFKFGSKGLNPGQFTSPNCIATDTSDQVYVTDDVVTISIAEYEDELEDDFEDYHGGISMFSEDGHFIRKINCNNPYAICISPDDYIICGDDDDFLFVLSPTHDLIAKLGDRGFEKGVFFGLNGIAINSIGTIFVTEYINKRLQIITTSD